MACKVWGWVACRIQYAPDPGYRGGLDQWLLLLVNEEQARHIALDSQVGQHCCHRAYM